MIGRGVMAGDENCEFEKFSISEKSNFGGKRERCEGSENLGVVVLVLVVNARGVSAGVNAGDDNSPEEV